MKSLRILTILMIMNVPMLWAQDQNTAAIDELVDKSGMHKQVEQIPNAVKAGVDQGINQNPKVTAEQKTNLENALSQAFDPTLMLKSIKAYIASELTQDDINADLSWLNSPLGEKINRLEEASDTADGYKRIQEYAQGLQANPPDPKRVAVIEKLDEAAHLTESDVKLRMAMVRAIAESMASASGQNDFSKKDVESSLEQRKPQIENIAKQNTIIGGLFIYQTLTDDELQQYINFYISAAGQKYANAGSEALEISLSEAAHRIGEALGQFATRESAKSSDTIK